MGVKIDHSAQPGNASGARFDAAPRLDRAGRAGEGQAAGRIAVPGQTDRVEVSADAKLLAAALEAASVPPDIRLDRVERARQALESGQLAQDPFALADRLIDDLVQGM
jgi:flagellar biosynthesis anti-sigma factor FlgM